MPDTLLKSRKAQIKMFETLAVLVVFFFFLIFGASFYFKIQENSLLRELERTSQLQAIQIAQKSLTMPEMDCSFAGVQRENCIDLQKVERFTDLLSVNENAQIEYFKTFKQSKITVTQVYPPVAAEWVVYERPETEESRAIQIPSLIYDSRNNIYNFGYIEVRVYE